MATYSPHNTRFSWSYSRRRMFDETTHNIWVLNHEDRGYYWTALGTQLRTPYCTRRHTAVRSLMNCIAKREGGR